MSNVDFSGISILDAYGEDLTAKAYVTDPAIARDEEIKKLMIVLLTPEKSGLLIGKAGIGKTAIVEGLAYRIQRKAVPNALLGYRVVKINSSSLIGKITYNGKEELIISVLVNELRNVNKMILFIDEIHTLIGAKSDNPMDLANIMKPVIDRGMVKLIGATTDIEYNTYIVRDRAFLRRFDRIDVLEPTGDVVVKILMGTLPKIEKQTGAKMMYTAFIQKRMMEFITDITSEYKRIYEIGSRYPDVSLTIVQQAFSNALYDNRSEVNVMDFKKAIMNSKNIYPDVIQKSMPQFDALFADQITEYEEKNKNKYERLSEESV